jgi:phosphohistidine phosphatase
LVALADSGSVTHPCVVKTLQVMRHAKSDWDDPELPDHDRPRAARGRDAAPRVAAWLRRQGLAPGLVCCSSARRTRETLDLVRPELGEAAVEIDDELYLASADGLLERVRRLPDDTPRVLLIGHNPGMQEFVLLLAGRSATRERVQAKFPTAALAALSLPVERWAEARPGMAELIAYVTPKQLD